MSPRRARALLALLLLGQLFLLAAQVPDARREGSALRGAALAVLGPPAHLVAVGSHRLADFGAGWRGYRTLAVENERLRQRLRDLERDHLRLDALALDAERLARAVDYTAPAGLILRPADVVYADYGSWLRTLVVYVGPRGAERNQAVVVARGVVGRVLATSGGYARVQLLSDRAASAAALIERTERLGVLRGATAGEFELDYVARREDVAVGDRVVTAGTDGIYPRGLPLGVVEAVEPGSELFWRIRVAPAVDYGSLDQVYLLERAAVPRELKEGAPRGVR